MEEAQRAEEVIPSLAFLLDSLQYFLRPLHLIRDYPNKEIILAILRLPEQRTIDILKGRVRYISR